LWLTPFEVVRGACAAAVIPSAHYQSAFRKVEGQIWVSNLELEFLLELVISMKPLKIQPAGGMARLTPRERDVVRLVAEGMRNQEVALKLNLREHTVRNYMLRIFDKLGISSRVELVLYAFTSVDGNAASVVSGATSASTDAQRI